MTAVGSSPPLVRRPGDPDVAGDRLRVVYLAGSGHTGSTLLAMMADAHPAIASVGEIAIKPKIRRRGADGEQNCSCGSVIAACPFWNDVSARVQGRNLSFGVGQWTNDYRFDNPILHRLFTRDSSQPLIRAFRRWAERSLPGYRERTRRIDRVNAAFVRAVLESTGAQVFFDTTKGPMRLSRILAIPEFDVRVVTLVRDVRAYAASARRRGKSLTGAAETWKKDQLVIRSLVASLSQDRRMLLRYEDLCADPKTTLGRLWEFCGVQRLDLPTRVFSQQHHVLGNNMRMAGPIEIRLDERWRREMAADDQSAVLRIAGSLNREFGYAP